MCIWKRDRDVKVDCPQGMWVPGSARPRATSAVPFPCVAIKANNYLTRLGLLLLTNRRMLTKKGNQAMTLTFKELKT